MAELADLVAQLRLDLEDPALPGTGATPESDSLWRDSELLHYISEAQKQFAIATECLPDSTNFTSSVKADSPWIERDPLIISIRSGYLRTAGRDIYPATRIDLERGYATDDYGVGIVSNWRSQTGVPKLVVTDLDAVQNRLVPIPTESDTIEWTVYRLPLEEIESTSSTLEVDPLWHYELLVWAKRLAYMKQDAETQDATRARAFESDWNTRVIPNAQSYFRKKNRRVGTTSYGGIY